MAALKRIPAALHAFHSKFIQWTPFAWLPVSADQKVLDFLHLCMIRDKNTFISCRIIVLTKYNLLILNAKFIFLSQNWEWSVCQQLPAKSVKAFKNITKKKAKEFQFRTLMEMKNTKSDPYYMYN